MIEEKLVSAITPIVPACVAGWYRGDALEYCSFQITKTPSQFGDDYPGILRCSVQLHWFLPSGVNPEEKQRRILRALEAAGGTYPSVVDASDEEGQHFVFETEFADGNV